jgi:hypothetical protein
VRLAHDGVPAEMSETGRASEKACPLNLFIDKISPELEKTVTKRKGQVMEARLTPHLQGTDPVARIRRSVRVDIFIAIALASSVAGGCGPKSAKFPTYTQPELLYVTAQRYTRLYVEVDVLEGVEVPQRWLDELRGFLSQHCDKPDGITMVRDAPIPASAVVGATSRRTCTSYSTTVENGRIKDACPRTCCPPARRQSCAM